MEQKFTDRDLQIQKMSQEDLEEGAGIGIDGPREHLKASKGEYACPEVVSYTVSQDVPPHSFCIDVRALLVQSQETINGEYEPRYLFWFAQHDCWDLSIQEYVERWFHTMQLRLMDKAPNISVQVNPD